MNIRKVENLFEALEPHPTKLLMTGDPADMLKAENELSEILGDRMDIFRSAPFFLELVPKGIDKAKSLLRLLSKINLTPADMIAFGDGYNDLSMLKLAGMGVAMQNAAPEVRAEADYITLSNDQVLSVPTLYHALFFHQNTDTQSHLMHDKHQTLYHILVLADWLNLAHDKLPEYYVYKFHHTNYNLYRNYI